MYTPVSGRGVHHLSEHVCTVLVMQTQVCWGLIYHFLFSVSFHLSMFPPVTLVSNVTLLWWIVGNSTRRTESVHSLFLLWTRAPTHRLNFDQWIWDYLQNKCFWYFQILFHKLILNAIANNNKKKHWEKPSHFIFNIGGGTGQSGDRVPANQRPGFS